MSAPIEILRILIPVHCSGIQTDLAEGRGLGHETEREIFPPLFNHRFTLLGVLSGPVLLTVRKLAAPSQQIFW